MKQIVRCSNKELKNFRNMLLSGIFALAWGGVKYIPSPVGDYFRFPVLKIFCKEIHSTYIGENITIWFPWNIRIGRHVSLNNGVILDGTGGIEIKDHTRIAYNVSVLTADHGYEDPDILVRKQGFVIGPITVGRDVWIGERVTITKGVEIGDGCVIGCCSVVTGSLEPYTVVAGNPCKVMKKREKNEK